VNTATGCPGPVVGGATAVETGVTPGAGGNGTRNEIAVTVGAETGSTTCVLSDVTTGAVVGVGMRVSTATTVGAVGGDGTAPEIGVTVIVAGGLATAGSVTGADGADNGDSAPAVICVTT
jgi:hypothetical protein